MNFLAHCALAADACVHKDEMLIVGGFLGDFQKGPVPSDLPIGLQRGIRLHRRIDAFSNQQADIRQSIRRFSPTCRRMAPVFVDILGDHFLVKQWDHHHPNLDLHEFCQRTYNQINRYAHLLPARAVKFLAYMSSTDLFSRYESLDTGLRAMEHVCERLQLDPAAMTLESEVHGIYVELSDDFTRYYPKLKTHCSEWLSENGH